MEKVPVRGIEERPTGDDESTAMAELLAAAAMEVGSRARVWGRRDRAL